MGLKFLPFTEVSLGLAGNKGEKQATPVTGAVILRYLNEEAANAGVERLKGHPIQTSTGVTKHLGAKHATPPKWVVQRRQQEDEDHKHRKSAGESINHKVRGYIVRVAMSGYGVIKSPEWGEVMWRQYELPTNIRTLQLSDKAKFQRLCELRDDYRRLKDMEGKEVEAELYKLPDGQLRASHVRILGQPMLGDPSRPPALPAPGGAGVFGQPLELAPEMPRFDEGPGPGGLMPPPGAGPEGGMPPPDSGLQPPGMSPPPGMSGVPGMPPGMPPGMHPGMGPPGMGPPPGMPGIPPGMDPYQAQMMMMQQMMGGPPEKKKKDKKDKKEKKEKKREKKRGRSSSDEEEPPKKRKIDDNDF